MGVIENRIDITELERSGGGGGGGTAASVSYDNTSSGLSATTVQGAIDEVVTKSAGKDQISCQNLLDNPFFTVNQRGETSYAGSNKYTFDRWKLISAGGSESAASVSISDGVVTLDPDEDSFTLIAQAFEDSFYNAIAGKVLTMSLLLSDDSIIKGTAAFTDKNTNVTFGTGTGYSFGFYTGQGFRVVAFDDFSIKAVKLEIGSVSTLGMDTTPNYAEELLKCQRYFQRVTAGNIVSSIFPGYALTANGARFALPLLPMRAVPTVTPSAVTSFGASKNTAANAVIPDTITVSGRFGNTVVIELSKTGGFTAESVYMFCQTVSGAYLDLSADL